MPWPIQEAKIRHDTASITPGMLESLIKHEDNPGSKSINISDFIEIPVGINISEHIEASSVQINSKHIETFPIDINNSEHIEAFPVEFNVNSERVETFHVDLTILNILKLL
ncbi:hypothetical protein CDAR_231451 [Caerostris darwini]|uniref:Uncharacterized protein n=1 Tax=Caerostris darwini TaxID=1538125 RepID=A0AAV4PHD8_9ARAC|nr:hypothetical protein CDAR_231451 [Caerostris darwini]